MDRRNFLRSASTITLFAAGSAAGSDRVYAATNPSDSLKIDLMGHRADAFTESQIDK